MGGGAGGQWSGDALLAPGVESCLGWERELDRLLSNWSHAALRSCHGPRGPAGKAACHPHATRNGIPSAEGAELARPLCPHPVSSVCPEGGRVGGGQSGPWVLIPSSPPRFPSDSSKGVSTLGQKNGSLPEAGGPVGSVGPWAQACRLPTAQREGGPAVWCLQEPGLSWRSSRGPRAVGRSCAGHLEASSFPAGRGCRGTGWKGGLQLSVWLLSWRVGDARGHGCPLPSLAQCIVATSPPGLSALCSTGSAALSSTAAFLGHVPRLLPHSAPFNKPTQVSMSPEVQMHDPAAVSAPVPLEMGLGVMTPGC